MADQKISQLAPAGPSQPTDLIPIERGGLNYSLQPQNMTVSAASTATNATNATTATNLAAGAANQLAVQTGAGTTGFVTAPTVASTYLSWDGMAFTWGAVSTGLTVGTTGITGGTSGRVLYDNAGVLGELATTGSNNVVLSTSPVLTTPNIDTATASAIKFAGATSGIVTMDAAAVTNNWTMQLPTDAGANGYVLQTDGSGNTTWVAPAAGGTYAGYWASFVDTSTQTIANPALSYVVALGTIDPASNGFTISSNTVTVVHSAVYTLQFSIQFDNSDTSDAQTVRVWLDVNGSEVPNSRTDLDIPNKHTGINGVNTLTVLYTRQFAAGDQFKLYWSATSTSVRIISYAAGAGPTSPAAPGVILSAWEVTNNQIGQNITIGSTGIISGTSGRILYDNAAVIGESGSLTFDGTALNVPSVKMQQNISAAAWTTNGIKLIGGAATLTDTTSSGTVAAAYTNVLGGNTIAATNVTTFTDYASLYLNEPAAGGNVTLTNKWSLIAAGSIRTPSVSVGTAGSTLGTVKLSGNTSGTVTMQTAAAAGTWTMTLPATAGSANQVLTTNGSGTLSWTTPSSGGSTYSDSFMLMGA